MEQTYLSFVNFSKLLSTRWHYTRIVSLSFFFFFEKRNNLAARIVYFRPKIINGHVSSLAKKFLSDESNNDDDDDDRSITVRKKKKKERKRDAVGRSEGENLEGIIIAFRSPSSSPIINHSFTHHLHVCGTIIHNIALWCVFSFIFIH